MPQPNTRRHGARSPHSRPTSAASSRSSLAARYFKYVSLLGPFVALALLEFAVALDGLQVLAQLRILRQVRRFWKMKPPRSGSIVERLALSRSDCALAAARIHSQDLYCILVSMLESRPCSHATALMDTRTRSHACTQTHRHARTHTQYLCAHLFCR